MYYIIYFFLKLIAMLPFRVLYLLSDLIYVVVYHIMKYRLTVVRLNLRNSFPEKDDAWRKDIEKKFYRHLCDNIVETIKMLHFPDKEVDKRIHVTNGELIDQLAQDGRSFMLLVGHYGNWEWDTAVTRHYHNIAYNGQIYRPLKNKIFDQIFLKLRYRFHSECIPQKKTVRTLLHIGREKQMVIGFVADQRPNTDNVSNYFQFLGQETNFSVGAEFIGRKLNAHFMYMDIKPLKRGHVEMTLQEIKVPENTDEPYPYTRAYVELMEKVIRRAPEYWLWSHNRWSLKYKKK